MPEPIMLSCIIMNCNDLRYDVGTTPTSTRHQTDLKGFETGNLPVEYVK